MNNGITCFSSNHYVARSLSTSRSVRFDFSFHFNAPFRTQTIVANAGSKMDYYVIEFYHTLCSEFESERTVPSMPMHARQTGSVATHNMGCVCVFDVRMSDNDDVSIDVIASRDSTCILAHLSVCDSFGVRESAPPNEVPDICLVQRFYYPLKSARFPQICKRARKSIKINVFAPS